VDTLNLSQEVNRLHADLCSALGDPTRILILYALAAERLNVSELAQKIGITQPAASRHLKTLRERGLVRPERQGPSIVYLVTDLRLIDALDVLRAVLRDSLHSRASLIYEVE
jgi:DNA-binding transcriptional ArsR family regulator